MVPKLDLVPADSDVAIASAVSVCATNRRDTAEREVLVAAVSVRVPTGSSATRARFSSAITPI